MKVGVIGRVGVQVLVYVTGMLGVKVQVGLPEFGVGVNVAVAKTKTGGPMGPVGDPGNLPQLAKRTGNITAINRYRTLDRFFINSSQIDLVLNGLLRSIDGELVF